MKYNFREIEKKWQYFWEKNKTYFTQIDTSKPKYYVLDMFPYPSGAGLHVGHPLGYIASDIFARFKRLQGFNVLHPMGYDAFGLPAEQYAIQTGMPPAITTEKNIGRYRNQLNKIGFSFDWSREVRTCDPAYYHWTQWAFIQMFNHYFCKDAQQARSVTELIEVFAMEGNFRINTACDPDTPFFSNKDWNRFSEKKQQSILLKYRLAYLADSVVNWCPELGTVLANDEVQDGYSIRGGHPVYQKKMRQWLLRVSAYAQRLFDGLNTIEWSESLKEMQRNWIGRSEGAEVFFPVKNFKTKIKIYTTRPDTIFGATFMVLAPESDLVKELTRESQKKSVNAYLKLISKKTERERLSDVKSISGVFTGTYAINPLTKKEIPIWISEYVLAGYGTGAIMSVPAHDSRDYAFAKHFNLPIIQVITGGDITTEAYDAKEGTLINSGLLNGLNVENAIKRIKEEIEKKKLGSNKVNFRIRDAIFSRQRYWGEPFPVYYKDDMPYMLDENELPLELPEIDAYLPTEKGEPPLGRAKNWQTKEGYPLELNTMPGFAGSSAYYLRYMDPHNKKALVSKKANNYWQDIDLYVGGTEHATGHLIYSRYWNKFLYDLGYVCKDEPFKKMINQGMIQGRSNIMYRVKNEKKFVSFGLKDDYDVIPLHVDVNIVQNDVLDINAFKKWRPEYKNFEFILENGDFICGWTIEKMSKSLFNVVNPDFIIEQYGADTLRLYEMFLGPIEVHKPWNTQGIDGVYKFLNKLWRLFHVDGFTVSDMKPDKNELKILHKTIKKVKNDIENFSMNTAVSAFMIAVNELTALKCNKNNILSDLLIILSPFAPHITEELWSKMGNSTSIFDAKFPNYDEKYLKESTYEYPVSFNGKVRFKLEMNINTSNEEIESKVLSHEKSKKWLKGKSPKKIIIVPNRIINIVI